MNFLNYIESQQLEELKISEAWFDFASLRFQLRSNLMDARVSNITIEISVATDLRGKLDT
jgi:hypothetical protein